MYLYCIYALSTYAMKTTMSIEPADLLNNKSFLQMKLPNLKVNSSFVLLWSKQNKQCFQQGDYNTKGTKYISRHILQQVMIYLIDVMNYWVISNNDITIKICFNTFLVKLRRSIIVIKIHHWSICVFSYFYRNFSWNKKKSILSLYTKYNVHQFVVSHIFIGISIDI